jgi:hypothetical protein
VGYSTKGSSGVYGHRALRRGTTHEGSTTAYKSKVGFGNAYSSGLNSKMKFPPNSSVGKYYTN